MSESNKSPDFTIADLIEAGRERSIYFNVPLPTLTILEDTEGIRRYVEAEITRAIEEWFDAGYV